MKRGLIERRLRSYLEPYPQEIPHKREGPGAIRRAITSLVEMVFLKGHQAKIKERLLQAGLPLKPSEFILINLVTSLLFAGCGILIFHHPVGGVLGVVGYHLPGLFLHRLKKKRLLAFTNQLSGALSLISNSLRAGYSFLQAMETVAKEGSPPIAEEFRRVLKENSLGVPVEKSLLEMTKRVPSEDLDLLVTAVLIQRQVGGNLAEVLDGIGHTIRERIRIQGEIRTLTAQGRMSGVIIGILPFLIGGILCAMRPDIFTLLFQKKAGWVMVAVALLMQTIGILLIKKIVSIKV
jgi:tight adherence protein B